MNKNRSRACPDSGYADARDAIGGSGRESSGSSLPSFISRRRRNQALARSEIYSAGDLSSRRKCRQFSALVRMIMPQS